MKVLSIIDSFKGTISSKRLNELVTLELTKKGYLVDSVAIADGGDGFCDAMADILKGVSYKKVNVFDPLFREIESEYLVDKINNVAYIELAKASGINLLTKENDTFKTNLNNKGQSMKEQIAKLQVELLEKTSQYEKDQIHGLFVP